MKISVHSIYSWYRQTLRNPKYRWWIILGTLAYLVSPIDVIPDLIPIAGQLDDVFLLTLLTSELSQLLVDGFKQRRVQADDVATQATPDQANSDQTVNVDAVSVN